MAGNEPFAAGIGKTNIDLLYSGIEKLPKEGEEVYSKNFSVQLGGGVPATLITLSRLGVKTKIATCLGEDIFSRFANDEYKKAGVVPLNLYFGASIPLNITSAVITSGDRTFISYTNGDMPFDENTLRAAYDMCRGAKVVLMQPGGFLPVYKKLKSEGAILVFDCGWSENLSLDSMREYLTIADYYTPNKKEALKITDTASTLQAAQVLSQFFDRVIIKLDKDGCFGMENGKTFVVPPAPDVNCVDSTGAGDAFLAGFVYGLFCGRSFYDCLNLGNLTGGKCTTKVGCLGAYYTKNELDIVFNGSLNKNNQ